MLFFWGNWYPSYSQSHAHLKLVDCRTITAIQYCIDKMVISSVRLLVLTSNLMMGVNRGTFLIRRELTNNGIIWELIRINCMVLIELRIIISKASSHYCLPLNKMGSTTYTVSTTFWASLIDCFQLSTTFLFHKTLAAFLFPQD